MNIKNTWNPARDEAYDINSKSRVAMVVSRVFIWEAVSRVILFE